MCQIFLARDPPTARPATGCFGKLRYGVPYPAVNFIEKPFTTRDLADKVRAVMDAVEPPPPWKNHPDVINP